MTLAAATGTTFAVGAFYSGMSRIGTAKAPILLAIDVPVGIALSALLLGERLSAPQLVGAGLVVAALVLLQLPARARRPRLRVLSGGRPEPELRPVAQAA